MPKIKKKKVLKAAEYLFATTGYMETTVADIAKKSGISEASIYFYYTNKKNILFAIYGDYLEIATKSLNEHFLGMKEPGPKLRKSIWHYLADMQSNPNYAKIMMMAQRVSPDFYASENVQKLKDYSKLVLEVVIAGQEQNFFRPDIKPRLIRNMAIGTCIFTVYDSIINKSTFDPHEYSDLIYQLVLNGTGVIHNLMEEKQIPRKRAELRKSQILETSTRAFSAKGFANTTITDIAKEANLGDATLYEYFDSKEAILLGISQYFLKDIGSKDSIQPTDYPEPERKLRSLIWRWIWKLYTNEDFSRVLSLELLRNVKFYSSPGYKFLESFLMSIWKTVEKGQQEGIFRDQVPSRIYTHLILGTIDQCLLSQFLVGSPPLKLSELNVVVNVLVNAIKAHPTA